MFEVPPPGTGLLTVIGKVPARAASEARIRAVSCVLFTNVVARASPLKLTTAPLVKFVPLTVRVNPPAPATALVGNSDANVGTGLLTVKFVGGEGEPPGFVTVTG